jgi:hypothetical protein
VRDRKGERDREGGGGKESFSATDSTVLLLERVCVRESQRKREKASERERESVCVCVCARERATERKGETRAENLSATLYSVLLSERVGVYERERER